MSYDIIVQEKNNEISFWKKKVNACEIKLAAETSKRDKVETLTKENSRLQSLIQEKDLEISKLRA
jgi:flagellar biosynthesis chaperone FliJ